MRISCKNVRDELKPQQKMFVFEYLKEINNGTAVKNASAAAIRAGYSRHTASEQSTRLLQKPKIRKFIDEEMQKLEKHALITATGVLTDIKEIGDRCMQEVNPIVDKKGNETGEYKFDAMGALRSRELLGKNLELFTDKVKQQGEVKINVVIQEDITEKMKKK